MGAEMGFLDLIGAVLTGGATGLIGTVVGGISRHFEAKRESAERAADREHEISLHRLNIEAGNAETERELLVAEAESDRAIRVASIRHDQAQKSPYKWVDAIRSLMRPVLTIGLFIVVGFLALRFQETRAEIVPALIYMSVTAGTWYFGDRAAKALTRRG
jgi:hypothetical protein